MKRYAKFGYAAPFRFRVILEKPQGGGQNDPPPPGRRLTRALEGGGAKYAHPSGFSRIAENGDAKRPYFSVPAHN